MNLQLGFTSRVSGLDLTNKKYLWKEVQIQQESIHDKINLGMIHILRQSNNMNTNTKPNSNVSSIDPEQILVPIFILSEHQRWFIMNTDILLIPRLVLTLLKY